MSAFKYLRSILVFPLICQIAMLSANEIQYNSCDQNVLNSVTDWATQMLTVTATTNCDAGTAPPNCRVGGLPVDSSCTGAALDEVTRALKSIRGNAGIGCLNQANANAATALLDVFQSGRTKICCGLCSGDTSGRGFPQGSCALTNGDNTEIALNIGPLTSTGDISKSQCLSYYPRGKGLEANIFHELLHAAGLHGYKEHSFHSRVNQPLFNSGSDDRNNPSYASEARDLLFDPVYACENLCYGKPGISSAASCLTCSTGEINRSEYYNNLPGEGEIEMMSGRMVSAFEQAIIGPKQGWGNIPNRCQEMWESDQDGVGKRQVIAALTAPKILKLNTELRSCVTAIRSASPNLQTELGQCLSTFKDLRKKCNTFANQFSWNNRCQHMGVFLKDSSNNGALANRIPVFPVNEMLQLCRNAEQNARTKLREQFGNRSQNIPNCAEWYPGNWPCSERVAGLSFTYSTAPTAADNCQ